MSTKLSDKCIIHHAMRATEEAPDACWEYDGDRDCVFLDVSDLVAALIAEGGQVAIMPMLNSTSLPFKPGRYLVFPIPVESAEAKETPDSRDTGENP